MEHKSFILDLGKLTIAAAWADGELHFEEINCLKDLLFSLPEVTETDWKYLEIYMDSPVDSEERKLLLNRVLENMTTKEKKDLVLNTMKRLVEADGIVDKKEKVVLEELQSAVQERNTGFLAAVGSFIRDAMSSRNDSYKTSVHRESRIEDFIKNRVYYKVVNEMDDKGREISLPEEKVRKLCLAAGLMARIAWADSDISEEEKAAMFKILTRDWGLSEHEAHIVTETSCQTIMKGLDYFRLTRSFYECTSYVERKEFLKCLFQIANASEKTSNEEIEAIRGISNSLKLPHSDFINAKLTIPREDRSGL